MGECKKMTTKKYTNRTSPPFPANKCKGKTKAGNDGIMYESVSDKKGIHKWVKAVHKSRKTSRKSGRKSRKTSRKSGRKSRKTSRKSGRKSRKTSRKSGRKSRKTSRKSGRKYRCHRAKTNTKEDLAKELRCHVRNWERITGRNEDLSNERIKQETISNLKKHLSFYRKNNP
jgi:hypothetical protein